MCGIVGKLGNFSKTEGLEAIQRMNNAILHRGPDDEGSWAEDGIAFGMRRLSIVDLKGGHQPIWTHDGVGIVFNGELYNYKEKREFLKSRGYEFATQSDTEVVLKLYHHDPKNFLKELEGMFGFCIIDKRNKTLLLVRDRLGIKPLYYSQKGESLVFASETKAVLQGLAAKPAISFEAIHHYLTLRYIPSPLTIWEGIFKLPPGHLLRYDLEKKNFSIEQYWKLGFHSAPLDPNKNYPKEFERLFLKSVESHLVTADVPVGVLLSGGLDSSAVAAAAVELGHRNFHTFNVFFSEGGSYDESSYAKQMASHIGSRHHEVRVDQKMFLDFLPDYAKSSDEPLADLASIPLHFVSKLARENVKVVLSGEGSDEVLGGYDFENWEERWTKLRSLQARIPRFLRKSAALANFKNSKTVEVLAQEDLKSLLKETLFHMTYVLSEKEKKGLWKKDFTKPDTSKLIESWYEAAKSSDPLDQALEAYCQSWLVEDLLAKADKMTMLNSIELRVPFLDHKIVEWAETLPKAWKTGDKATGYSSKRILRDFSAKRLPKEIINRSKRGFPVPAYQWLNPNHPQTIVPWAKDLLLSPNAATRDWFDSSVIETQFSQLSSGDLASAHKVWNLLILESWVRAWQ